MLGAFLRFLRRRPMPKVVPCQPPITVIGGPGDGEIVGKYTFGNHAWAEVRGRLNNSYELGDLYGDRSVPGRGTALLRHICQRADKLGCTLSIQVVPPHERRTEGEKDRLRALYAKHGFAEYPERDPEKWMLREPRSERPDETAIDETT